MRYLNMSEQTPAHVADKATIAQAINLRSLSVIGLMKAHDGLAALLRSGSGQIARVGEGDTIFGVKVVAIAETYVTITDRWGATRQMGLPQG
ncbi:hypothetical protein [Yoonia sp. SS1-5]|uniref:Pilus assembly protein PilP n=1 Tax=Yoonia rhodophyticola TaxID=3137370 RepID=A0AAN0M8V6_9RHOB